MSSFALVAIFIGILILVGLILWIRQREQIGIALSMERLLHGVPLATAEDNQSAVLVSTEHGQLMHINDRARYWLDVESASPDLESIAAHVQPPDNFLNLFVAETQSSFQIGNRWVQGASHLIPGSNGTNHRVVVMRELSGTTNGAVATNVMDVSRAMAVINNIGEMVNASMGVEPALQVLLDILNKVIASDAGEISIWDEDNRVLQPRGWVGDTRYLINIAAHGGVYELGQGVAGWVAQNRMPLLINGVNDPSDIDELMRDNPYTSLVSLPISLGDRFIGTLTLFSEHKNTYADSDVALLQATSKAIGIAIYNAVLYAQQEDRIRDIASLQQITEQSTRNLEDAAEGTEDNAIIFSLLNERMANLLDAEMCGIFIYDKDRAMLIPQLPFFGLPDHVAGMINIPLAKGSMPRDIWENQPYWVSGDMVGEPMVEQLELKPIIELASIRSTGLFPMQIGGERIGLVAISNKRDGASFTPRDIQSMRVLSTQAAIVVENLRLYQEERRIDSELLGLQSMTEAMGSLSHEGEFYAEITERIANLMNSAMCGILIYDARTRELISQPPYYGVADELVGGYRIPIPQGSVMEELWDDGVWFSNRVQADTIVFEVGLDMLAEAANVQKTLMTAMSAGGRRIGAIQVSNKLDGSDYASTDVRLLQIFATQAGAVIENARLYREVQYRAEQAESLRRVAELASSILTEEQSFEPILAEIARFMDAKLAFMSLVDSTTNTLVTHPRWTYGMSAAETVTQDLSSPGYENIPAVAGEPFYSNDLLNDKRLLAGYRRIAERFGLRNSVSVPLLAGDRILGEIGVANRDNRPFDDSDINLFEIIASQMSSAVERIQLYEATDENLRYRVRELDAISRVSNELTATFDLDPILHAIIEESLRTTSATGMSIAMLHDMEYWQDETKPQVERRFGDLEELLRLTDIEVEACRRMTEPVLISDFAETQWRPMPADIRSGLAAPIVYQDQVVGVLYIYSENTAHFDDRDSGFIMTLASKASLGYQNHTNFKQREERGRRLSQRVDQLNRIFELGQMIQSQADLPTILEAVAYSIQHSVGYDTVLMMLVDEVDGVLRRVAHAGMPLDTFQQSQDEVISVDRLQEFLKEEFRVSLETYFFPIERIAAWAMPDIEALSTAFEGNRSMGGTSKRHWRDGDKVIVKITGQFGNLLGLIALDRPYDNLRPDRQATEVLEIFGHQASTIIENKRLFMESERNAEQEAQLSEMMEAVASTLDLSQIAMAIGEGTQQFVSFTRLTLALTETDGEGYDYLKVRRKDDGTLDVTRERRATLEGTALGRTVDERREYHYTADDEAIRQYDDLRRWYETGEEATMILPLVAGGENLGALHLGCTNGRAFNTQDTRQLLVRMSQLVSSTLQNVRLFNQAVNLQILNQSVIESIQQGIIVLDNSGLIITINEYMRHRFGWDDDAVQVDLLSYQPDLEPVLKDDLRAVLEQGMPRERLAYTTTEADGNTLIRNFFIYPLRSAEAVRGAVMLIEDATERVRLEREIEARAEQLAALTDSARRITQLIDREEVIELALGEMDEIVPFDTMTFWWRTGSYMVLQGQRGFPEDVTPELGMRVLVSEDERIQELVDTQRNIPATRDMDVFTGLLPGDERAQSWLGIPLVDQGHVAGMIVLTSEKPNLYQTREEQYVTFAFGSQVAIALANANLFQQTFDRTNELSTVLQAAQATSLMRDVSDVFNTVSELMFSALEMETCVIMTWDDVDDVVEVKYASDQMGSDLRRMAVGTRYDLSKYPARLRALQEREVIPIIDIQGENAPPFPLELEELREVGYGARLLVPLVVRDQSVGLILLEQLSNDEKSVTQQKVRLARTLGSQVAVAIENARLSDETTQRFTELVTINELSRAISSTLSLNTMLPIIRDQVPAVTGADEMYLALYDTEKEEITFPLAANSQGELFHLSPRPLGTDEVSYIIKRRHSLSLGADYFSLDELRRSMGITNGEGDIKSYMGVPVLSGDQVLGVLAIRNTTQKRTFDVNDDRILTTVGTQLGAAIQNARLYERTRSFASELEGVVQQRTEELEQERDRLDTLYQITSELSRTLDMENLLDRALGMVAKAVEAEDGVIFLNNPAMDSLYVRASLNPNHLIETDDGVPTHPAEGLATWLLHNEELFELLIVVDDLVGEHYWDEAAHGAAGMRSAIAVILEYNEDPKGVVVLLSSEVGKFDESHLKLLVPAANQMASSMSSAELYGLIRESAERVGRMLSDAQRTAQKNQAILEGISDGVMFADGDGNIVTFNTAAERILQISRDEVIGRPISRLAGIYGADALRWAEMVQRWSSRAVGTEFIEDVINDRIELGDYIVSTSLSPVYIGDIFLGTVSVFRDITRDVEADRIKSAFVENVSHELRTPLTPIKGYTDMLLMGAVGDLSDMQVNIMNTIKDNVERLNVLVEDILNVAKLDGPEGFLVIRWVDLHDLVPEVFGMVARRAVNIKKNIESSISIADDVPRIRADREKLHDVIKNVIENAFNYNLAGGKIDINVAYEPDNKSVLLTVADTGVGIPDDFKRKVWERFERFQDHAVDLEVAGTGLGLSFAKDVVERHKGEIWFESETGVGTTFFIRLPVEQPNYVNETREMIRVNPGE